MPRILSFLLAALAGAGIVVAGERAFADGEEPAAMLRDIEWQITEIAGSPLAEDSRTTISFAADGAFFGRACNSFRGSYTTDGDTLDLGPAAAAMMACPEPIMRQERALFDALEQVASWRVGEDGTLTLGDADGAALIVARP